MTRVEHAARCTIGSGAGAHDGSGDAATDWGFESLLAWQLEHEPPVPVLCLTSAQDVVVPEAAVRAFAGRLRATQPARAVNVALLDGPHCQLALSAPHTYRDAIAPLLHAADDMNAQPLPTGSANGLAPLTARVHAPAPVPAPAPAPAPATVPAAESVAELLGELSLEQLAGAVATLSTAHCFEMLESGGGRLALLNQLKELGVERLPDRQAIANAVGKLYRASNEAGER